MVLSRELRERARESLKGKYWKAFAVSIIASVIMSAGSGITAKVASSNIYMLVFGTFSALISVLIGIFVGSPIMVGVNNYFIKNTESDPDIGEMFSGFKIGYGRNVATLLLVGVKTFLWTLLFIVPGIIKSYEYAMIPYILADNAEIGSRDAFIMSKKMMTGNKWRLFKLQFSFIGWFLLCVITCGIGAFFLSPYLEAAQAEFYKDVKKGV